MLSAESSRLLTVHAATQGPRCRALLSPPRLAALKGSRPGGRGGAAAAAAEPRIQRGSACRPLPTANRAGGAASPRSAAAARPGNRRRPGCREWSMHASLAPTASSTTWAVRAGIENPFSPLGCAGAGPAAVGASLLRSPIMWACRVPGADAPGRALNRVSVSRAPGLPCPALRPALPLSCPGIRPDSPTAPPSTTRGVRNGGGGRRHMAHDQGRAALTARPPTRRRARRACRQALGSLSYLGFSLSHPSGRPAPVIIL